MQRAFVRAVAVAAGLILVLGGCSSAASPAASPPALNVSPAAVSQAPSAAASSAASPSAVASASPVVLPSPEATATPAPSAAPSASPASGGVAGSWNGTWHDKTPDQAAGSFVVTLAQNGTALTGSITVKGTPCLSAGTVTGTVNGTAISFGAVSGRIQISYSGSISGTTMKGTYTASAQCSDATGTWEATKK